MAKRFRRFTVTGGGSGVNWQSDGGGATGKYNQAVVAAGPGLFGFMLIL